MKIAGSTNKKFFRKKHIAISLFLFLIITGFFSIIFQQRLLRLGEDVLLAILGWANKHGFVAEPVSATTELTIPKILLEFSKALLHAPITWWETSEARLPLVRITIKPDDLATLDEARQQAKASLLLSNEKKFSVPAELNVNNDPPIKIKLRLKGDVFDHFSTDKWSMRINIPDKHTVFGMQSFSVQSPITRDCLGPLLIEKTIHLLDPSIIMPRFFYIHLELNKEDKGIMAVEEHFAPALLQRNKKMPSVMIKFDETLLWNYMIHTASGMKNPVYNNYLAATVLAFNRAQINKSKELMKNYRAAVGLMRGFLAKKIPFDKTFDVKKMAVYIATLNLWGSSHGLQWNNWRFYYNPATAKLEPIPYDVELEGRLSPGLIATRYYSDFNNDFHNAYIDDPSFQKAYQQQLRQLKLLISKGNLVGELTQYQDKILRLIGREFFFYRKIDFNFLSRQINCLLDDKQCLYKKLQIKTPPRFFSQAIQQAIAGVIMNAYIITNSHGTYLELQNLLPLPIRILHITGINEADEEIILNFKTPLKFPFTLARTPLLSLPQSYNYYLQPASLIHLKHIRVTARARLTPQEEQTWGKAPVTNTIAQPYVPILEAPLTLKENSQRIPKNNFIVTQSVK